MLYTICNRVTGFFTIYLHTKVKSPSAYEIIIGKYLLLLMERYVLIIEQCVNTFSKNQIKYFFNLMDDIGVFFTIGYIIFLIFVLHVTNRRNPLTQKSLARYKVVKSGVSNTLRTGCHFVTQHISHFYRITKPDGDFPSGVQFYVRVTYLVSKM